MSLLDHYSFLITCIAPVLSSFLQYLVLAFLLLFSCSDQLSLLNLVSSCGLCLARWENISNSNFSVEGFQLLGWQKAPEIYRPSCEYYDFFLLFFMYLPFDVFSSWLSEVNTACRILLIQSLGVTLFLFSFFIRGLSGVWFSLKMGDMFFLLLLVTDM